MSDPRAAIEQTAARIADELLFGAALDVDASAEIPRSHLRALADAGLFGIAGPASAGGLDLDARAQRRVRETLAGGCLTTAFVWGQHQGVVRRLRGAPAAIRDAWLEDLCAGRRLCGVVLAGLLPGEPRIRIAAARDGFVISGSAPAVSGWGYFDALLVTARRAPDDEVVYALVAADAPGLHAHPRTLAALNGTRTVALDFHDVRVGPEAIVRVEPLPAWAAAGDGVRANGAYALGVAGRCARIDDDAALRAAVDRCREQLDTAADGEPLADARAAAALLAARAAAQLVVRRGASALDTAAHAQRLAREAIFLLAFGQRPQIRDALLGELAATAPASQMP